MRILVVIHSLSHYRWLEPYIKTLCENNVKLNIYLVKIELERHYEEIKAYGIVNRVYKLQKNKKPLARKLISFLNLEVKIILKKFFFLPLYFIEVYRLSKYLKYWNKYANDLLDNIKPDLVLLSAERYIDLELSLAYFATKRKMKTMVVGIDYFFVDGIEGYARQKNRTPVHTSDLFTKYTARRFPNQTFEAYDTKYLFFQPHFIWLLYFYKMQLFKPYLIGSSYIDYIIVDCEYTKNYYVNEGISEDNVYSIGNLENDDLNNSIKEKNRILQSLVTKKIINLNKKIIILGVPQLYEHNLLSREKHFKEIKYLVDSISKENINLILSLHPKMNRSEYDYLEKKNVVISEYKLKNIMAISDIYISTYSSTVLWSIQLGIPSILVDFYDMNYKSYNQFEGVVKFTNKYKFELYLKTLIQDESKYLEHKQKQFKNSLKLGILDGKSSDRFLKIIDSI